jgi:hypothetical protein
MTPQIVRRASALRWDDNILAMAALGRINNKVGKNLVIQTSTDGTGFDKVEPPNRYILVYRKIPAPNFAYIAVSLDALARWRTRSPAGAPPLTLSRRFAGHASCPIRKSLLALNLRHKTPKRTSPARFLLYTARGSS